ncbi:MAG: MutS protein msh5 [Alyxoria varia]|nr:MAG: MutS protein msh5 [Alyxoria varia]
MSGRRRGNRSFRGSHRSNRLNRPQNHIRRQQQRNDSSSQPSHLSRQHTPLAHQSSHHGSYQPPSLQENPALGDIGPEDIGEVVMAVDLRERGSVGCSYYVSHNETLYFMEDAELGNVEIVDMLKLFIEPTMILVSSKADDAVLDHLDPGSRLRGSGNGSDPFDVPYMLELRPPSEFHYESSIAKLANLPISTNEGQPLHFSVPGDAGAGLEEAERDDLGGQYASSMRLSGWVSLESRLTVGCAGAVLTYLQRRRNSIFLPGDPNAAAIFRVSTVEMFSLAETMFINGDALHSLQIMQSESHPSSHNQGPTKGSAGSKEGLSVYGLFHHLARTPQGKYMLRQYFLRPSLSIPLIKERLISTSTLIRPENSEILRILNKSLAGVINVRKSMISLRKGIAAGSGKAGRIAVDFERSTDDRRTTVKAGVDEHLDEQRRLLDGIDSLLSMLAQDIANNIPVGLPSQLNVIYFPQIGFLIAVPQDEETGTSLWEGTEADPWERTFKTEEQVYYKNRNMHELDEHFGDIDGNISGKFRDSSMRNDLADPAQIEKLRSCTILHNNFWRSSLGLLGYQIFVENLTGNYQTRDLTYLLTFCFSYSLLALAEGAKRHNLTSPSVTMDNVIEIDKGWHPLQTLAVPSFVPNDVNLVGGHDWTEGSGEELSNEASARHSRIGIEGPSMVMMTGPNFSGKSIYLKQTALIVYMAHIGSFVPAEKARIGITDKILTRIATRESVSRAQSAFMIDLQQMSMALKLATPRSLLVIDEFGKGTGSAAGAGLACGVFEYLLSLGPEKSPKVVAATHFHEIFENGFLRSRPALQFAHMEVHLGSNTKEAKDQVTYLYNLRLGRSNASLGTCCAALNGIALEIIHRAEDLVKLAARGEDLVAACAVLPRDEAEDLKVAEHVARAFIGRGIEGNPRRLLDEALAASQIMEID